MLNNRDLLNNRHLLLPHSIEVLHNNNLGVWEAVLFSLSSSLKAMCQV